MSCLSVATLWLLTASALAQDETVPEETRRLFVSDKLVLNVYAEADQSSSRVATIETGDAVDELERAENFVRVRLSDGREGWVGTNYLTDDAPAAVQLRELQRQQKSAQGSDKKAAEEIARLRKESQALQTQVQELKAAAAAPAPPDDGVLEGAVTETRTLATTAPADTRGANWIWALVVVLTGGLAYAAGYQSLARKIRKKFGGLRIY